MKNHFTLGSEWRVWDLQVQTILDDRYVSLSEYYEDIKTTYPDKWNEYVSLVGSEENAIKYDSKLYFNDESESKESRCTNYVRNMFAYIKTFSPNVGCIGITDHNYWDSCLLDTFISYSKGSKIKAVCGVEVNISGVHILVFFKTPPFGQPTFSEGIKAFLNKIDVFNQKTNGVLSVCTLGIDQVLSEIRKHKGIYIFPHCNSSNGLFQERGKTDRTYLSSVFNARKRILLQGNSKESVDKTKAYISTNPNKLFKAKAIFTTSPDSRCLNEIGRADASGNYCWIKSNPGFVGLEQIVYEPELRVFIGSNPPSKIERSKIIKSIAISNSNGWFSEPLKIEFNESQVCLIGGKGSGKTALLDIIAFAANSFDYNETSFLCRSSKNKSLNSIAGTNISLEWYDGKVDSTTIPSILPHKRTESDPINSKLLYLSQNYVERLCSFDQLEALNNQIEAVIFQKVPKEEKSGYSGFQSYKESRIEIISKEKQRYKKDVTSINADIAFYRSHINREEEILLQKKSKVEDLNQLLKEYKEASDTGNPQQELKIKNLQELKEDIGRLELDISTHKNLVQKSNSILYSLQEFNVSTSQFVDSLKQDMTAIGIDSTIIDKISFQLSPQNLDAEINEKEKSIKEKIIELQDQLESKRGEADIFEKELNLEKNKKSSLILLSERISKYKEEISALSNDLNVISTYRTEIENKVVERKKSFFKYLVTLKNEMDVLKQIYAPIASDLSTSTEQNTSLLSFVVSSNYDIDKMVADGGSIIDHSKAGNFYRKDLSYLRSELQKICFDLKFESENGEPISDEEFLRLNTPNVESYLDGINNLFQNNVESQLRKGASHQNFDDWLFNMDVFKVGYNIYFNGTPLSQLSPGMKGMALLILFLELDNDDNRPILIDQPEENLDNRSVFETLRSYFRRTKNRRQILIATHNPNLVVNTDSEQVIIANFSRNIEEQAATISYISGSLECDFKHNASSEVLEKKSIKEHICHILEGGEEAFKQRELRYGLI